MDLNLIKQYFQACLEEQTRLENSWKSFQGQQVNAYSLYTQVATKYQDRLTAQMIEKFIVSFNWQGRISPVDANKVHDQAKFKLHARDKKPQPNSLEEETKLLKKGIEMLVRKWGNNNTLTIDYDNFSQLICGRHEMPNSTAKNIDFRLKQNLFENLIKQIEGEIRLQSFKKAVYHQYRNIADLFEMLSSDKQFGVKNLQRLFLNQGEKKETVQLQKICKRAQLPMNFDTFLDQFKSAGKGNENKQYKVFYSSIKNKKHDQTPDRIFTTPRHDKARAYPSSTKLTKGQIVQLPEQSRLVSEFTLGDERSRRKTHPSTSVELLSDILYCEQEFISLKTHLIMREDFDMQLVYKRHGKQFQAILNQKYGACNFSAFSRFIIPTTYQHKYLAFIRYQSNNELSQQTEQMIEQLLSAYRQKQKNIKSLWAGFKKQIVYRSFCQPSEDNMSSEKIREYFTKRQTQVLVERFDPCKRGYILLEELM